MSFPAAPEKSEKEVLVPELIKRYLDGESIQVLAAEQKVTRRTIYNWMLAEVGDAQYHDLVTRCLVARVADADERLEGAVNILEVTRAKEMARFSRMDFERRRPALYGAKQEMNVNVQQWVMRLPTPAGTTEEWSRTIAQAPALGRIEREVDGAPAG